MEKLPRILGILTLVLLMTPALQQVFRFKNVKPLNGVTTDSIARKDYSWWSRGLQASLESYSTDSLFIRPSCIRTRNQFEFTFFDKVNAQDIYEHHGVFFRYTSPDYNERNAFSGMPEIRQNMAGLVAFARNMSQSDIPVYVVITPSKLHYFRDQLPAFNRTTSRQTDYIVYSRLLREAGIEVLDVDHWYLTTKHVKRPPVMSKSGVHWTLYGGALAMDSLMKRINHETGNQFEPVRMVIPDQFRMYEEDRDVANLCNLIFTPEERDLRVPDFPEARHPEKRLRPVIISDSYFHVVDWTPLHPQIFHPETPFYYYFHTRYSHSGPPQSIDKAVVRRDLEQADCVIFMTDIQNLPNFCFGFPEYYRKNFQEE